ncbi:PREDICTED: protein FAM151B isoform X2 [Trachymyrmex cornetzi]|uniref:protein FAM151B isoform X2 n=1 Tax=Trachymyrmex cornetzi TaxID=471704 RepID=UPI00084F3F5E|nr:PREDICTED: protein FAM151B isoform X2 [Trachymyrmex cornetzi]
MDGPTASCAKTTICNNCSSPCYPKEFFPNIKGNLTKIKWAHRVNSLMDLDKALVSADVMMLEGDVTMGKHTTTTNATTDKIPIMAHPPATESDLSLEEFININVNNGSKGIKLDFKSNEAFNYSKPILIKFQSSLKCPVILNADIVRGPVNATAPQVNASEFLVEARNIMPNSIFSVGWTTKYGKEYNITEGRYNMKQLKKMIDILTEHNINQPVTYPVRAGLATNDIDGMKALLKNTTSTGGATLTIWSLKDDYVDVAKLSKLIKEVGTDKVYLDIPEDLRNKLNLSSASTMTSAMMMNLVASLAFLVLSRML